MTSLGAEKPDNFTSNQNCKLWEDGINGIDAIHHQAVNYIVEFSGDSSRLKASVIASHYRQTAEIRNTRECIGSYDFHLVRQDGESTGLNSF